MMFQFCSNLSSVTCLATNPDTSYTSNWLHRVSGEGTFFYAEGVKWPAGTSGIPEGWTAKVYGE